MDILVILLVLLIHLVISFSLFGFLYFALILPMQSKMESLTNKRQTLPKTTDYYTGVMNLPSGFQPPESNLPDMEDIPLESLYGDDDEEDFKTTPEEVEDAIAERTERSYNTYSAPRTTSLSQLGSLK